MARLIFLHGGPGYRDYLRQIFEGRFPEGVKTEFYSQISHDKVTIEELIEQLAAVVAGGVDDTFLVGHSWGGPLALEYLRRTGDARVKGLVLIGSYFCSAELDVEFRNELKRRGLRNPTLEQVFFTEDEMKVAGEFVKGLESGIHRGAFRSLSESFIGGFDARDFVRGLKLPVLNIFGECDLRVPARMVREFSKLNGRITNLEIKGAGHFPFLREGDRVQVTDRVAELVNYRKGL